MNFYFLWSWIGLVIAIFLIYLLFFTDKLRNKKISRFKDCAWYSWLPVPIYLLHQFEEYACHITNGQFDIVSQFYTGNLPFDTTNLPVEHFPLVNIALVWFGAPLAAILFKKNPVIGFSYFGFMFLNGITHIAGGLNPATNPGLITGALLFVPSSIYMVILSFKEKILSSKKIFLTFTSGILAHIFLFLIYFLAPLGKFFIFVGDIICGFSPIIFAYLGLKFLKIK